MKIRQIIFAVGIIMVIIPFGCKKTSNTTNKASVNPARDTIPIGFSAKINNVLWVASKYSATIGTYKQYSSDLAMNIEAFDTLFKYVAIGIIKWNDTTGVYITDGTSNAGVLFEPDDTIVKGYRPTYESLSGKINITKISSNNIQGTFSALLINTNLAPGTTTDTISITDGVFNLPLAR